MKKLLFILFAIPVLVSCSTNAVTGRKQLALFPESALREQSLDERDFRVTKLAVKAADYDKAKDIILRCHRSLQRLSVGSGGDDVYAFNTQFFKLTGVVKE